MPQGSGKLSIRSAATKGPYFQLPPALSKPFTYSSLQQTQFVLTLTSNNETNVFLAISLGHHIPAWFPVQRLLYETIQGPAEGVCHQGILNSTAGLTPEGSLWEGGSSAYR